MSKKIMLTCVMDSLKKEAISKIENFKEEPDIDFIVCENGHNKEYYENLNVPLPKELEEKIKNAEKNNSFKLSEEDMEEIEKDVLIYEDFIAYIQDDVEYTFVYLKNGVSLSVRETAKEINEKLNLIN